MDLKVHPPAKLEEGKHYGEIVKVSYKNEPYEYTVVHVKPEGKDFEIRYSVPTYITERTALGQLLAAFGADVEYNNTQAKSIDPEKLLVHEKVEFMTKDEKGKDGKTYAEIVEGTLKPRTGASAASTEQSTIAASGKR